MDQITGIEIPRELELELRSVQRNVDGETNAVFFCKARFQTQPVDIYVKVAKGPRHSLANERDVLEALSTRGLPGLGGPAGPNGVGPH